MRLKVLVSNANDFKELPHDYLKYDVVVMSNNLVLHSRKSTRYLSNIISDTKLYCHKCFTIFSDEEEAKNHKC